MVDRRRLVRCHHDREMNVLGCAYPHHKLIHGVWWHSPDREEMEPQRVPDVYREASKSSGLQQALNEIAKNVKRKAEEFGFGVSQNTNIEDVIEDGST